MGFGRHVGGGDDVLIFYGWRERVREYVRALGGEMGGRCLWVRYHYLLVRTKNLWLIHQNRRMRRYVRKERTLSLFKGLMDVKPCVHNCDRVKFMNCTLNDCMKTDILLRKKNYTID